jgi:hypothetical protein
MSESPLGSTVRPSPAPVSPKARLAPTHRVTLREAIEQEIARLSLSDTPTALALCTYLRALLRDHK